MTTQPGNAGEGGVGFSATPYDFGDLVPPLSERQTLDGEPIMPLEVAVVRDGIRSSVGDQIGQYGIPLDAMLIRDIGDGPEPLVDEEELEGPLETNAFGSPRAIDASEGVDPFEIMVAILDAEQAVRDSGVEPAVPSRPGTEPFRTGDTEARARTVRDTGPNKPRTGRRVIGELKRTARTIRLPEGMLTQTDQSEEAAA